MIGLALGGGGARGVAHIGILRHLENIHILPDIITGTSAGAVIGALYAHGVVLDDIYEEIQKLRPPSFTHLSRIRFGQRGLFVNTELETLLTRTLGKGRRIEDSPIPLGIHVTDIEAGAGVTLTHGPLTKAILASCCVPGIFIPQEINNRVYIDGAVTENVPVTGARKLGAKIVIGVNLNGIDSYPIPERAIDTAMTAIDIAIDSRTKQQMKKCDIALSLNLRETPQLGVPDFKKLVDAGELAAKEQFNSYARLAWLHYRRLLGYAWRGISFIRVPDFIKKFFYKIEKKQDDKKKLNSTTSDN